MSYGLRGYDGHVYGLGRFGLGCNPGETRDVSGGQEVCGSDGATWSAYAGPAGSTGGVANPTNAAPSAVYVAPAAPVYATCDPRDVACVMGNQGTGVAYRTSLEQAAADQDYGTCLANGTAAATCRARWPAGYAGNVPYTNLTPSEQAGAIGTPAAAAATYAATVAATNAQFLADQAQAAAAGTTAGGASVPPGATVPGSPALTSTLSIPLPAGGSFDLSSIPWWGWASVAAVGLLAVGGKN